MQALVSYLDICSKSPSTSISKSSWLFNEQWPADSILPALFRMLADIVI
jgi:hypothetical protein